VELEKVARKFNVESAQRPIPLVCDLRNTYKLFLSFLL
jgi:hypothetical protein